MKRIITLTALALGLSSGIALADHRGQRGGGPTFRDHRGERGSVVIRNNGRGWDRDDRVVNRGWNRGGWNRGDRTVRVERTRPVFRDNRFYFGGGTYRPYVRPVINFHYRDYYRRPALVVENYEPVTGYIWIQGNWSWNNYEWIWMPGHYEVDQSYSDAPYDSSYNGGYYDNSSYDNGGYYDNSGGYYDNSGY